MSESLIVSAQSNCQDSKSLHPDLFWIERGWHPVCPTICVMFLASHQALLSGNNARRLMCAGGAAEYSANSAQQIWTFCHMTAPKRGEQNAACYRSDNFERLISAGQIQFRSFVFSCCGGSTSSGWLYIWFYLVVRDGGSEWLKKTTFCYIWLWDQHYSSSCRDNTVKWKSEYVLYTSWLHHPGCSLTAFTLLFKNASTTNVIYDQRNHSLLLLIKSAWWSPTFAVLHTFLRFHLPLTDTV